MKCAALKPDGTRCKRMAESGGEWCYSHDPANAKARQRDAARGGKIKAIRARGGISEELARLQEVFEQIARDVLEGEQDRGDAAVAIQALNGARGCLVGVIKAKEVEEMAQELADIKELMEERTHHATRN